MRILHWTDNFLPLIGGLETFVRDLARAQRAAGHEIHICTSPIPGLPEVEAFPDYTVHRRASPAHSILKDPRRLGELARAGGELRRRLRPDLVHVHLSGLAAWLELIGRAADSAPVLLTAHTTADAVICSPALMRRILGAADLAATVSADLAAGLDAHFPGARPGPYKVVLNGAAPPALAPSPLRPSGDTLLAFGRVVTEKGFDLALRALALLPVETRLVLAGDGPARPGLEALAAELGVTSRVDFRGWVHPDDVPALINASDCVLMPSRWREPFGLVAVHAGQMGRPLVAARVGGLPEIVRDGETGLLVPPEDPATLAAAIRRLQGDPAFAARIGAAARRHTTEHFSMDRCAADYSALYARLLRARAPSA